MSILGCSYFAQRCESTLHSSAYNRLCSWNFSKGYGVIWVALPYLSPSPPLVTGEEMLPSTYHFPCGVLAGILASVTTQPADVMKTRMQLQPNVYGSFFNTLAVILQNNGVRGLFSGLLPRATRRTLASAFMWTIYEEVSHYADWWKAVGQECIRMGG